VAKREKTSGSSSIRMSNPEVLHLSVQMLRECGFTVEENSDELQATIITPGEAAESQEGTQAAA